ncbi:O-antigen/teichoic acid export membrane protein [Micromonospora sp. A202]|uniref:lipopolysaccharide biosynthesis protein n=1 Tax=Micromonospora sp. A202 TaxID=2572899 RepID=UPI001170C509|nr:oligosaccharide flippase family protein [Micromonospora sp. A202]TQJ21573.1 O-antigen/teichoic acid export membrane protein [Micromonospora sp. A202]
MTQKSTSRAERAQLTADPPLPPQDPGAPAAPKVQSRRGLSRLLPAGRDRRLSVDIATSLVAKGVGLAAPLVITPACFRYLGDQRYGLWMAITALTGMAWFADLGLGNGLLTRLSLLADDPRQRAREISSAYATLGVVALALLAGLVLIEPVVPWSRMFGVTDPAIAAEASALALLCFGAFAINVPLSLIQRVQYARAQVIQSNAWQAAGALSSMVAVLAAIAAGSSPLTVIACAVLGVPLTNLINTVVYFWRQESTARPRPGLVHRATAVGLLRLGLQFFALSAMSSIALNVDSPLIAHVLGLSVAAYYAVVGKLFGVLSLFVALVGMTVWPANGAALARGDTAWVRRTTRRMVLLNGLIVGTAGLALVVLGHRLLDLWVGGVDTAVVPVAVLAGLALWSFLVAVASPLLLVQNSIGLLRPQFVGWAAFLLLATALKLAGLREFGLVGLPLAGCLAYLLTIWPAAIAGYRRALATSDRVTTRSGSEVAV